MNRRCRYCSNPLQNARQSVCYFCRRDRARNCRRRFLDNSTCWSVIRAKRLKEVGLLMRAFVSRLREGLFLDPILFEGKMPRPRRIQWRDSNGKDNLLELYHKTKPKSQHDHTPDTVRVEFYLATWPVGHWAGGRSRWLSQAELTMLPEELEVFLPWFSQLCVHLGKPAGLWPEPGPCPLQWTNGSDFLAAVAEGHGYAWSWDAYALWWPTVKQHWGGAVRAPWATWLP